LSSTTDRRVDQRGQILPLLAGGLIAILLIAALVFDVGQSLLDRRTEQNSSDAAALAGARYLTKPGCQASPSLAACPEAVAAARQIATDNGYTNGANSAVVTVKIPPGPESNFSGLPGYIEVDIGSTRPSFFMGVMGIVTQRTAAMAVAANAAPFALPYSLLALDPTGCGTNFINGNGASVTTNGTVHVDSSCPSGAVALSGSGVLTAPECDVVGGISTSGGAHDNCTSAPTGVQVSGDPLRDLPPPAEPGTPAAVQSIPSGSTPPGGCPGNSPATDAAPGNGCVFNTANKVWRVFPGNYPGGITVQKGTVYMDPGIYWIGGGGVQVRGPGSTPNSAVLISKATGDDAGLTPSGGVLIYNTQDPDPTIAAACATTPGGPGCYGPIFLNGGASTLGLTPYQSAPYQNMVIFMDRAAPLSALIDLNGGSSNLSISGTIYAPHTILKMNGGASDTISAQLIVWNFQLNGNGSSLTVNYNPANLFKLSGTGLVQ
jgi:Putative Flp pilus-assembly TadE/G-like